MSENTIKNLPDNEKSNDGEKIDAFEYSVLIVDDSLLNIHVLTNILSDQYNISVAENGRKAIEMAEETRPDVILLDIIMPELDGYAVITALKSMDRTKDIPIIIITALIDAEDEEKGLALGAVDYIAKPFNPAIVKLRVQNQIKILQQINMVKQSSIVEHSPFFIFYLTTEGNVSYLNPAAIKMTGYSEGEIREKGLELIFDNQTVSDIKDILIPNTLEYGTSACEVHMVQKDQDVRILSFTGFVTDTNDIGAIAHDVTQVRRLEVEVAKIYYDALTGIYNRRFFDENFERVLRTMSRGDGELSLLMIDIDYFKYYNDAYGHKAGDNCLKAVAEALTKGISRQEDFVARYGGEEFVAVLPYTDAPGAKVVAERLLLYVQDLKIPHKKSEVADHITVSIGAATGRISHPVSSDALILRADEMLYKSKQEGRNRITYSKMD